MGLLDHLWDDTVAGPRPDSGLGKLRKHSTFSFRSNSGKEVESNTRSMGEEAADDSTRVTRSIMIVKPPQAKDSPPVSPAGSTPPVSPFGGGREAFRFRRRSGSFSFEKASGVGPKSPLLLTTSERDGFQLVTSAGEVYRDFVSIDVCCVRLWLRVLRV